jgi:hypothetical protein
VIGLGKDPTYELLDEVPSSVEIGGNPHASARIEEEGHSDWGIVTYTEINDGSGASAFEHLEVVTTKIADDSIVRVPHQCADGDQGNSTSEYGLTFLRTYGRGAVELA